MAKKKEVQVDENWGQCEQVGSEVAKNDHKELSAPALAKDLSEETVDKKLVELVKVRSLEPAGLAYQTSHSAGVDLPSSETFELLPNKVRGVKTGVRLQVTGEYPDVYGQLSLRSSWRKRGVTDMGVGVIDIDYKDEIIVLMFNTTMNSIKICAGDRIAQLVFVPIQRPVGIPVRLDQERDGGFGSTGK